jgi:hypothetical protein
MLAYQKWITDLPPIPDDVLVTDIDPLHKYATSFRTYRELFTPLKQQEEELYNVKTYCRLCLYVDLVSFYYCKLDLSCKTEMCDFMLQQYKKIGKCIWELSKVDIYIFACICCI